MKTNLEFILLEFGVRHDCNLGCSRLGICVEEAFYMRGVLAKMKLSRVDFVLLMAQRDIECLALGG